MKTVLITGAARRLGRGLALNFAKVNWNIAIIYNSSDERALSTKNELIELGIKAEIYKADVRDSNQVRQAMEAAFSDFNKIDVLVNNSGIYPEPTSLENINDELWDNVINTNLRGEFYTAREFSKYAQSGSKIINIASLGAFEIWKQRLPYNVSKAAIIQLTKALARELAPKISVNSVSPGSIYMPDDPAKQDLAIDITKFPMQRYGLIEDVFDAVRFFAECSSFITGQNLNIDGGYHLKS